MRLERVVEGDIASWLLGCVEAVKFAVYGVFISH